MRIVGASGPSINVASATRRTTNGVREPQAPVTETRALIAIEATASSERAPQVTRHPAAAFLAHLIATKMQAPQTRARRRAEPEEAIAVYQAMTAKRSTRGRSFGKRV